MTDTVVQELTRAGIPAVYARQIALEDDWGNRLQMLAISHKAGAITYAQIPALIDLLTYRSGVIRTLPPEYYRGVYNNHLRDLDPLVIRFEDDPTFVTDPNTDSKEAAYNEWWHKKYKAEDDALHILWAYYRSLLEAPQGEAFSLLRQGDLYAAVDLSEGGVYRVLHGSGEWDSTAPYEDLTPDDSAAWRRIFKALCEPLGPQPETPERYRVDDTEIDDDLFMAELESMPPDNITNVATDSEPAP